MANLVALRSAIRASRAALTASCAMRRSMAAGLSASDLARAARSSWAFFASAAALRRSAKLVFLDLFISVLCAQGNGSWPKDRRFQIGARHAVFQGMDETKLKMLARLSLGSSSVRLSDRVTTSVKTWRLRSAGFRWISVAHRTCSICRRSPSTCKSRLSAPSYSPFRSHRSESQQRDQVVHPAIEMTAPSDPPPARRQPMLPASNPEFRRQTVLDEKQLPARFENPKHLISTATGLAIDTRSRSSRPYRRPRRRMGDVPPKL